MIDLETSVALAHLLAEDRVPPESLWRETLVASRLIEYEMWIRLNARGLAWLMLAAGVAKVSYVVRR